MCYSNALKHRGPLFQRWNKSPQSIQEGLHRQAPGTARMPHTDKALPRATIYLSLRHACPLTLMSLYSRPKDNVHQMITASVNKHTPFVRALALQSSTMKLLSSSWFGALKTVLPTGLPLRRNVFVLRTPVWCDTIGWLSSFASRCK